MRAASLVLALAASAAAMSCLDEVGQPVDWFAAIKRNNTFDYAYMGPKSMGFSESNFVLSDPSKGAVSQTLSQLFTNANAGTSHVFYNDQPPVGSSSSTYAHSKGVVGADDDLSGFWLVHSTPRFPEAPEDASEYPGMPQDEHIYGQSFLCISVKGDEPLSTIGGALFLNRPHVYGSRLSPAVQAAAPALAASAAGKYSAATTCNVTKLQTPGGASFTVFAKPSAWASELYADCVAPALGSQQLLVESWIRGEKCGPACGSHQVLDVGGVSTAGWGWRETQDHSKWAVTGEGSVGCIGDINRMTSQAKRGGGTVCTSEGVLAKALRAAVTSLTDSC